jgi:hypothetical protein
MAYVCQVLCILDSHRGSQEGAKNADRKEHGERVSGTPLSKGLAVRLGLISPSSRGDREYLFRSLLEPDLKVDPGYEMVALELKDGRIVTGATKSEKDGTLTIETPEGLRVAVNIVDVE